MGLPVGHGLDTLRRSHAAAPGVPVMVLTGLGDETLAAEAMKEGAPERHRMQTETDLIGTLEVSLRMNSFRTCRTSFVHRLPRIYQFATILLDKLAGEFNLEQLEYLEIVLRNVKQL